jgi:hypothetical protein
MATYHIRNRKGDWLEVEPDAYEALKGMFLTREVDVREYDLDPERVTLTLVFDSREAADEDHDMFSLVKQVEQ